MNRNIIIYGVSLGTLALFLKWIEYEFLVRTHAIDIYMGLLALLFTVLGLWMGRKLTRKKTVTIEKVVYAGMSFQKNEQALSEVGLSRRECEVLELMAEGLSNQEIADRLFVSLPTIKTHSSNLFLKLQVNRRTQAVSRAKELRLIP